MTHGLLPVKLSDCERILIVKPSSLGDIVHTLPAVEALRRAVPGAQIDWLVNTEWSPLLEGLPFLTRRILFPRRECRGLAGLWRARAWASCELTAPGYDLALDFQGLFRSAYFARRAARLAVGFRRSREGASALYQHRVELPDWDRRHAVSRNLALVESLGVSPESPVFLLPQGERPAALPEVKDPVLLHPFSRGAGKSLSRGEVRELCALLAPRPVLLVGVPVSSGEEDWPDNTFNLLGRTSLSELIYLLRQAAWTISVDSGPMHLAAGLSGRVLSLHTWSNPAMVGPWPPEAWIWRESRLVQVKALDPEAFPEQRQLAAHYAARPRLLEPGELEAIAAFVHEQLGPLSS